MSAFRLVKEIIYESAQSRVLVVSCFKNINETFLREDFFKLTHFWCLKHHIFLSERVEPEIPPRSGEKIHDERLDFENFKQLVKELKFFRPDRTQVLISGRENFIEFAREIAEESRYKNIVVIWTMTGTLWYFKLAGYFYESKIFFYLSFHVFELSRKK